MNKVISLKSKYQHFIRCNLRQHRQLAAKAWRLSTGVTYDSGYFIPFFGQFLFQRVETSVFSSAQTIVRFMIEM